jgi:hypothetical protein
VPVEVVDALPFGFGWTDVDDPLRRTSHALAADGGVWLVDALDWDGLDARLADVGEVRGVVQLLDRHDRDCEALARRWSVQLHRVPRGAVRDAPFEFVHVLDMPGWREAALWWPEARVLACGDALGTVGYFLAPGERIGVHPLLRFAPPRRLAGLAPAHVVCGHGAGVHGPGAGTAVDEAIATARRRLPAAWLNAARGWRRVGFRGRAQ